MVAARGPAHLKTLADAIADNDTALHPEVRDLGQVYLEQIEALNVRVAELDAKMKLLGQRLMARDFDRQVAEVQVRIAVMNGYTALGIPITEAVG